MTVAAGHKNGFNTPETLVRSSHALTIVSNGITIGLINQWSPKQSRQITPVYEINFETSGLPYENIPGNVQNLTLDIQRYDLWTNRMEQAFGTVDLTMLSNQKSPFQVEEYWTAPSGQTEVWRYLGCWFNNVGRTFSSNDTRVVNVNASMTYVYRELAARISG